MAGLVFMDRYFCHRYFWEEEVNVLFHHGLFLPFANGSEGWHHFLHKPALKLVEMTAETVESWEEGHAGKASWPHLTAR